MPHQEAMMEHETLESEQFVIEDYCPSCNKIFRWTEINYKGWMAHCPDCNNLLRYDHKRRENDSDN